MIEKMFIDCVTHALTGPAILRAAGINRDGTVSNATPQGLPSPVVLILLPDQVKDRINTIRVAVSSEAKHHNVGRTFEVSFNNPIPATINWRGRRINIVMLGMYCTSGGMREVVNRVIHEMQNQMRSIQI